MNSIASLLRLLVVVSLAALLPAGAQTRGAVPLSDPQGQARPFSASYALVIGIDKYDAGWTPLKKAVADANAVAEALQKGGFQKPEIKLDLDGDELDRAIKDFIYTKGSDPDARLLIWFAGHGHTIGGEGYLVPRNAPLPGKTPAEEAAFQRVAMPLESFGRYMNEVKARHVIAIFDSCFSGSIFSANRASAPASVVKATTQVARQFIASGSAGETALDNGAFREAFVAAVAGQQRGALTEDGFLTGSRLGAFLAQDISRKTGGQQNPIYSTSNVVGYDRGDFVFPASFPTVGQFGAAPIVSDLGAPKANVGPPPPEVRVEKVEIIPGDDPYLTNLADKLTRNLVEYYVVNRVYVTSTLTGRAPDRPPTHIVRARVSGFGDDVTFDIDLTQPDGTTVATASFGGPKTFYMEYYKVLPPLTQYMLDTSIRTFDKRRSANRPTEDGFAYGLFLAARQKAMRNQWAAAAKLVEQAITVDENFAPAYAALAELALRRGEPQARYDELMAKASELDPDYTRLSVFGDQQMGDPVPALQLAAADAPWQAIADGLEYRRVETTDYNAAVLAWRFDQAKIGFSLVKSQTSQGETAAEMRKRQNGVLAINAGFFNLDLRARLSPVGMIVVGGKVINPFDAEMAKNPLTGLLFGKNGKMGAIPAKDYAGDTDFESALQTGPLVVDPGGKNGIRQNNFDRQNRSVICFTGDDRPVVIQVSGGLSLYEVGEFLSAAETDGGFGCERAINLDGGPSSQVSVNVDGFSLEVPGLWKISSALVLKPR